VTAGVFVTSLMFALLPATSGCNVGPDFVTPKVTVNAGWRDRSDPRLATGAATNREWWRTLNDPTLDQLVELAYRQNLPLKLPG
jgi:outer membrane protein TolC